MALRSLWAQPWGYRESGIILLGILIAGFGIEASVGSVGVPAPSFPLNVVMLSILAVLLVVLHCARAKSDFVKWLSSIPASTTALIVFFVLAVIAGVIPQVESTVGPVASLIGATHVVRSWPFVLVLLFILVTLGLASLKRLFPFKKQNLGYAANHLGLWIVVAAMSFGAGDLQRMQIPLQEGRVSFFGEMSGVPHPLPLPFAVKLHDFSIDEFSPQITLVDEKGVPPKGRANCFVSIEPDLRARIADWRIQVQEYLSSSAPMGERYVGMSDYGTVHSAYVVASHLGTKRSVEGWISAGSFRYAPEVLKLDDTLSLAMLSPVVKRYLSKVSLYFPSGEEIHNVEIEVNKPFSVNGWDLYQASYDKSLGKWSESSVLEAVFDPWLSVVYFGLLLLTLGSLYLIWQGRARKV